MKATSRISSADLAVLRETKAAVAQVHRLGIAYADIFSPLHDDWIADALKRLTIQADGVRLGRNVLETVTPPVFGRYFMQFSLDVDHNRRRFAKRHGMGHVVAGHVSEIVYLSSEYDYMSHEERVADLFALADMVPFAALEDMRVAKLKRRDARQQLLHVLRQFTEEWPSRRLRDRVVLRENLFRVHAL